MIIAIGFPDYSLPVVFKSTEVVFAVGMVVVVEGIISGDYEQKFGDRQLAESLNTRRNENGTMGAPVGPAGYSQLDGSGYWREAGWMTKANPFKYFNSSPKIIRLTVMMYVRFPLSLRNVEDLLHE